MSRHKADSMTNCMSTRRICRRDSEDPAATIPTAWKDVQVAADASPPLRYYLHGLSCTSII